jgi:hypothetical protein
MTPLTSSNSDARSSEPKPNGASGTPSERVEAALPTENAARPNDAPETANAQAGSSPMDRAEKAADHVGEKVAGWASMVGHGVVRFAALTREAFEDFWAEVQTIRHHKDKDKK